jgi:hypothetical protein
LSAAHEFAAFEFLRFAPSLEPLRVNAEIEVGARGPARVPACLGCEGVADLVRDLGIRHHRMDRAFDEDDIARRADADADPARSLKIAAGPAGGRCGDQQRAAVPQERQQHQMGSSALSVRRGHSGVDVTVEPVQCVLLALFRGPGRRGSSWSERARGHQWRAIIGELIGEEVLEAVVHLLCARPSGTRP